MPFLATTINKMVVIKCNYFILDGTSKYHSNQNYFLCLKATFNLDKIALSKTCEYVLKSTHFI